MMRQLTRGQFSRRPHFSRLAFAVLFACAVNAAWQLPAAAETVITPRLSAPVIARQEQKQCTAAQAAKIARAQHGGKVLGVEARKTESGAVYYRVKLLLDNGRVKTVTINCG